MNEKLSKKTDFQSERKQAIQGITRFKKEEQFNVHLVLEQRMDIWHKSESWNSNSDKMRTRKTTEFHPRVHTCWPAWSLEGKYWWFTFYRMQASLWLPMPTGIQKFGESVHNIQWYILVIFTYFVLLHFATYTSDSCLNSVSCLKSCMYYKLYNVSMENAALILHGPHVDL